jgi:hypothetical protein
MARLESERVTLEAASASCASSSATTARSCAGSSRRSSATSTSRARPRALLRLGFLSPVADHAQSAVLRVGA